MLFLVRKIVLLVFALIVAHISAIYLDFYQGKVWVDIPLHIIAGIALGLIWLWIMDYRVKSSDDHATSSATRCANRPDFFITTLSLIGWVLLFSLAWEWFEFLMRENFLELAKAWKIYPPNLRDTLSDMTFGLLGGAMVILYKLIFQKLKRL